MYIYLLFRKKNIFHRYIIDDFAAELVNDHTQNVEVYLLGTNLCQAICLAVLNISSMFRCQLIYQFQKTLYQNTVPEGKFKSVPFKVLPSALTALSTGVINLLRVKSNLRVPPDHDPPRLTMSGKIFLG